MWESGLEAAGSPGEDEDGIQERTTHHWPLNLQEEAETTVVGSQQEFSNERTVEVKKPDPLVYQQRTSGYV